VKNNLYINQYISVLLFISVLITGKTFHC